MLNSESLTNIRYNLKLRYPYNVYETENFRGDYEHKFLAEFKSLLLKIEYFTNKLSNSNMKERKIIRQKLSKFKKSKNKIKINYAEYFILGEN